MKYGLYAETTNRATVQNVYGISDKFDGLLDVLVLHL